MMAKNKKDKKKSRRIAKEKRHLAEVAAEKYWQSLGCMTRRAVRARYAKVDLFHADVVGKHAVFTAWTQVTTAQSGGCIRKRRRNLETVPWLATDRVLVFEWRETEDPLQRGHLLYFFRVHEYAVVGGGKRDWLVWKKAIPVPREWLKARRTVGVDDVP